MVAQRLRHQSHKLAFIGSNPIHATAERLHSNPVILYMHTERLGTFFVLPPNHRATQLLKVFSKGAQDEYSRKNRKVFLRPYARGVLCVQHPAREEVNAVRAQQHE